MSAAWIIMVVLGGAGVFSLLWLALSWLTKSWEVIDDDQLSERLSSPLKQSPAVWMRLLGWFTRGPRRLTYRRDQLGRFRKIWRG